MNNIVILACLNFSLAQSSSLHRQIIAKEMAAQPYLLLEEAVKEDNPSKAEQAINLGANIDYYALFNHFLPLSRTFRKYSKTIEYLILQVPIDEYKRESVKNRAYTAVLEHNYQEAIECIQKNPTIWDFNPKPHPSLFEVKFLAARPSTTLLHALFLTEYNDVKDAFIKKIVSIVALQTFDIPDSLGRTPLHIAAIHTNIPGMHNLHQRGTNPNLKDFFGRTPIDYIRKNIDLERQNPTPNFRKLHELQKIIERLLLHR